MTNRSSAVVPLPVAGTAPCRRFTATAAETCAPQVCLVVALSQNLTKSPTFASVASRRLAPSTMNSKRRRHDFGDLTRRRGLDAYCHLRSVLKRAAHVLRPPRWRCHVPWRPRRMGNGPAVNNLTSSGAHFSRLQVRGPNWHRPTS